MGGRVLMIDIDRTFALRCFLGLVLLVRTSREKIFLCVEVREMVMLGVEW